MLHTKVACATLWAVVLLCGCGGGGGGSDSGSSGAGGAGSGSGGGGSSPDPSVSITAAGPTATREIDYHDELSITVTGTWAGTNLNGASVYLQLRDPSGTFAVPSIQAAPSGGGYSFAATAPLTLAAGDHAGTFEVRACQDAVCATPYPNASASMAYAIKVNPIADWTMMQGNASHTGYVPITLNPSRFALAWQWSRTATDPIAGINPVVTSGGKVYVSSDVYFGEAVLYAIDEAAGTQTWQRSLGQMPAFNPPAIGPDGVFVATTGHQDTFLWLFDTSTGNFKMKTPFDAQWPHVLAPTIYGSEVYTNGGYYGGGVYAYTATSGVPLWHALSGDNDMSTPAVDAQNVYYHSGTRLEIWNRLTGASAASIPDPLGSSSGYSYHGAPLLGGRNNVVAFSGDAFSGRASSNVEQYGQRVLSSFSIANRAYEWSTQFSYLTAPALANGVIYAGRNNPMSLDAIDERTGQILWSWVPPSGLDNGFHRNIVATKNLLFVSTDRAVYAIDLTTHQSVWTYPKPGMLALSANRTLLIATGATQSDDGLVAIKLQ
jgi:outer membrane protein assembly factor BamB